MVDGLVLHDVGDFMNYFVFISYILNVRFNSFRLQVQKGKIMFIYVSIFYFEKIFLIFHIIIFSYYTHTKLENW